MKEAVAIAKEADAKKRVSPTKSSDNSTHRARNEPERQLGSLRDVIGNIRRDGSKPSVESIATQLSGMPTGERAPVLLALQQTHGNRYVQRVVAGIQAKLKVGQPGDKYEQEADRVADEVMQMPEPQVQRQLEEETIPTKPIADQIIPMVQRQVEEEEEEKKERGEEEKVPLMIKSLSGETPQINDDLEERLSGTKGLGDPLPADTGTFMEDRFGADFSAVRIHTDSETSYMARALNAEAFTYGRDIYFGAGKYSPGTFAGKRLLAHELTHVVQQHAAANMAPITELELAPTFDAAEQEADRVAEQVSSMQHQAENDGLAPTPNIPLYLQSVLTEEQGNIAQYKLALQTFRREYSNNILDRYRSKLGEPDRLIEITQTSPLKQIRCMGRPPSEREEALERLPGNDEFVTEVCTFFFPSSPPTGVNPQLRQLASEMLWEATEASRAIDLVPRPTGGRPGPGWLVTQGVKIAWRRAQDSGYYEAVRATVARNYRSAYEMAKLGI